MTSTPTPEPGERHVWLGDARSLPWTDRSVNCFVTSPPYWGQRDYGHPDQIGKEPSYLDYIESLCLVADEMHRCLADDGTLWLNLGDTYNTRTIIRPSSHQAGLGHDTASTRLSWREADGLGLTRKSSGQGRLKDKDLMGLPWRVANALVDRGWWLRSDVIWSKPYGSPKNQPDAPRRLHEYVFMLAKSSRYRFDKSLAHRSSVWEIAPTGSDDTDHEAVFPDELVRRCIAPSTVPGDVVADPFGGSGTTARVASEHGRIGWSLDLRDWTTEIGATS